MSKMQEFCGDGVAAYTTRHMKTKLLEHFDTDVLISSRGKKTNLVTLRIAAWKILSQYFESPQTHDPEAKKLNLITTAAKLIKSDIRGVFGTKDVYPGSEDIKSAQGNLNFVPESLQLFLKTIFCGKENDSHWPSHYAGRTTANTAFSFASGPCCADAPPICISIFD